MLETEVQIDALEMAIFEELARVGSCSLEELNERLPSYSWNQVFSEVDRLSRKGAITLQRSRSFDYSISLGPHSFADPHLYRQGNGEINETA